MFTIKIKSENKCEEFLSYNGEKLYDALKRNNITLGFPCGGKGNCGKCKVTVKGRCPAPAPNEKKMLSAKELESGVRLACLLKITDNLVIEAYAESNAHVLANYNASKVFDPILKKLNATLGAPLLQSQQTDFDRLKNALQIPNLKCPLPLLRKLPIVLRENNFSVSALLFEDQLVEIAPAITKNFGIATDIGTTTIAMYLVDLNNGKVLAAESALNPQKAYGADVITRISYTMENADGTAAMQNSLIEQLNHMIARICTKNNIESNQIYAFSFAANTIITHFLLGLPTENISKSPFIPAYNETLFLNPAELGIHAAETAVAAIAPGASAYVGGDIVSGVADCGLDQSAGNSFLIDIGTNGEIVLGGKDGLICCSAAAGPAFEGGHIECGIGGVRGAINKFNFNDGSFAFDTIENAPPAGICGSGILDIVSELCKKEIIDTTGFLNSNDEIDGTPIFKITENIYLSLKDIRQIQMAKAAISAGIKTLLKEKNITAGEIGKVYLAGGFGNYMDVKNAVSIGLIPREFAAKIVPVGNTSGSGAIKMLLDKNLLFSMDTIKNKMQYIELGNHKYFTEAYIDEMMFAK